LAAAAVVGAAAAVVGAAAAVVAAGLGATVGAGAVVGVAAGALQAARSGTATADTPMPTVLRRNPLRLSRGAVVDRVSCVGSLSGAICFSSSQA
jgi:hypothetical protein